jgi:UDP-galactopyranose mutase
VWKWINQFAEFNNYINSPVANYKDELFFDHEGFINNVEKYNQPPYTVSIIKDDLDESNHVMKQYDEILLLNSTISQKQLDDVKKSRRDWYFTAEEALKYGMVDEIE